MEEFPTTLTLVLQDNYTTTLYKKVECLSATNTKYKKPIIKASLMVSNNNDMSNFYAWWVNDINNGTEAFTITLPFMGVMLEWEVKILDTITTSIQGNKLRAFPLTLELQEDIMELFPDTSYGKIFPYEVGCLNTQGFQEVSATTVKCLKGTHKKIANNTLAISVLIESNAMLSNFANWYINELNFGTYSFNLETTFMGKTGTYNVKFIGDLTTNLLGYGLHEITMRLEVMD